LTSPILKECAEPEANQCNKAAALSSSDDSADNNGEVKVPKSSVLTKNVIAAESMNSNQIDGDKSEVN